MVAIAFSILVAIALLSIYSDLMMRLRLTMREVSRDRLVWWRRGQSEVTGAYQELFPHSRLPMFAQFAFWLVLTVAGVGLAAALWKSR
jgi:hypothetical protein